LITAVFWLDNTGKSGAFDGADIPFEWRATARHARPVWKLLEICNAVPAKRHRPVQMLGAEDTMAPAMLKHYQPALI